MPGIPGSGMPGIGSFLSGGNSFPQLTQLLSLYNQNTTRDQRQQIITSLQRIQTASTTAGQTFNSPSVQQQIQSLVSLTGGINPQLGTSTQQFFNHLGNNQQLIGQGLNGLIAGLQANEVANSARNLIGDLFGR